MMEHSTNTSPKGDQVHSTEILSVGGWMTFVVDGRDNHGSDRVDGFNSKERMGRGRDTSGQRAHNPNALILLLDMSNVLQKSILVI